MSRELIQKYFTGTATKIDGIGFEEIYKETMMFHEEAFVVDNTPEPFRFESGGVYEWRKYGEHHAWNPESVGLLQWATRTNDYSKYKEFSKLVDEQNKKPAFIRSCFKFKKNPIPIEEVEPIENIMARFVTGAMSYGSISKEAHEALAITMNTIGGRSNTGEGGEDPSRFGTNKNSKIKQVASGRFGVTNNYLVNADELQIKVAQEQNPEKVVSCQGIK